MEKFDTGLRMKPIGYYGFIKFAYNSDGPFCFFNLTNHASDRRETYWSDEDFGFILFPLEAK